VNELNVYIEHQLGSACHILFRNFIPRKLSRRQIGRLTTNHWISSNYPSLFSIKANWRLCLHPARALSLQTCLVTFLLCLGSSMWNTLIVPENLDSPPTGNSQVCHPRS